jgi:hypothetical protein
MKNITIKVSNGQFLLNLPSLPNMHLRFFTRIKNSGYPNVKKALVFLFILLFKLGAAQPIDDVKKQADKLWDDDEFVKAYKLYGQLVANYPKDPVYNYRLGVCMIYAEPDKKKCIPYLKQAANNAADAPKDVYFYLGKAYHINYLFNDALAAYNTFKSTASASLQKKLKVDMEIASCQNGKKLLANLTDVVVQNKKELNEADYFRSYDLKSIGGKLLVKPEEFKTPVDKKKKERSVIFLPKSGDVVFFSSYGETGENGRDIYMVKKEANGLFGKPVLVEGINTPYDEDYPFLHPDGTTLYFASKGHNSMGGYDIFVTRKDPSSGKWSPPVNLEFPINSPDDDYLYVTDSLKQNAFFSTGRQSPPGKIDVLKVKTERKAIDILAVQGSVKKELPKQSVKSKIDVTSLETGLLLASVTANEEGLYNFELPNGSKLLFSVETPGLGKQEQEVMLPQVEASRPCRQTITYQAGKLKIESEIEQPSEEDYQKYLKLIEQKAKLEVNDTKPSPPIASKTTQPKKENVKPQIIDQDPPVNPNAVAQNTTSLPTNNPTPSPSPAGERQQAETARKEAGHLRQEAGQLRNDAKDAYATIAEQQKIIDAAKKDLAVAEQANDKEKAEKIQNEITRQQEVLNSLNSFARSLEEDAAQKNSIASLNEDMAVEIERGMGNKDKTLTNQRVEIIKQKIADQSGKSKSSDAIVQKIKADLEIKEKELESAELDVKAARAHESEVSSAIRNKETELANTRKKKEKARIEQELEEDRAELGRAHKEVAAAEEKRSTIQKDTDLLRQQTETANKIVTQEITTPQPVPDPVTNPAAPEAPIAAAPSNLKDVNARYKSNIASDPSNPITIEENNKKLNEWNQALDALTVNLQEEQKSANPARKTQIGDELKGIDSQKKKNTIAIDNNNKSMSALASKKESALEPQYTPVTASTPVEAVTKLDALGKSLERTETENFDYNGYQDPKAQQLKLEADARINDAMARQKKLREEITVTKNNLPQGGGTAAEADIILKEEEELHAQAESKRTAAKQKQGPERDRLYEEAGQLDKVALDKHLQAIGIMRNDNARNYQNNAENIERLKSTGKSSPQEMAEATVLLEQSRTSFQQAADIRKEADAMSDKGAQAGAQANAEEKESEAILKQLQAIELLKKSNPDVVLKTLSAPASGNAENLQQDIGKVNQGLDEVNTIKFESYSKLYGANDAEVTQLQSAIGAKPKLIGSNPALKTEYLSANKKLNEATELRKQAETATTPGEKLKLMTAAVKKQNDAVKQLNKVAGNSTGDSPVLANSETQATNNPQTVVNVAPDAIPVTAPAADINETTRSLDGGDTTANGLLTFFRNDPPEVSNPTAAKKIQSSLEKINALEKELQGASPALAFGDKSTSELRKMTEGLNTASEEAWNQSVKLKQEAETQKGTEKEATLQEVSRLQELSLKKRLDAAQTIGESNKREMNTNDLAISELLERLRKDNGAEATALTERLQVIQSEKTKASQLRSEAGAMKSLAARNGAYSNAEEKESEILVKQSELLKDLLLKYPDYTIKDAPVTANTADNSEKYTTIRSQQADELTMLANALTLEYETSKGQFTKQPTPAQAAARKNADAYNADSKKLIVQAAKEKNLAEKMRMLTLAAKAGDAALKELSKGLPKSRTNNPVVNTNEPAISAANKTTPPPSPARNSTVVKIEGLEVKGGNAYTDDKPIPLDAKMPDGWVFRVQIGAFKSPLPNNAFRGLSPLNGETTTTGYFRYTAGNFNKYELANAVKNDLRGLGYTDAFVVAYFNGKRLSIAEALAMLSKEGKTPDPNAPQTAGITANANVPKAEANPAMQVPAPIKLELETTNGLLFTIQIGVYNRKATIAQMRNIRPIFTEKLPNGVFRYTAGIYADAERVRADRTRVVAAGFSDAFITAYLNGKRIPFADGRTRQANDPSIKMASEDPVVIGGNAPVVPAATSARPNTAPAQQPVNVPEQTPKTETLTVTSTPSNPVANPNPETTAPAEPQIPASTTTGGANELVVNGDEPEPEDIMAFSNFITAYPATTPQNGIRTGDAGIAFRVEIGMYKKEITEEVAAKYRKIRNWPIEHKYFSKTFIYTVGNFTSAGAAKSLLEQCQSYGITSAVITVYKDGKKLSGPEAQTLLNQ